MTSSKSGIFAGKEGIPKNVRGQAHPHANTPHFCRVCAESFPPAVGAGEEPAHTTALIHRIRQHDRTERYVRCGIYCDQRQQPEEVAAKRQLYGRVIPKHTPAITYTKGYGSLFPDD